jgi:hypothetical protein
VCLDLASFYHFSLLSPTNIFVVFGGMTAQPVVDSVNTIKNKLLTRYVLVMVLLFMGGVIGLLLNEFLNLNLYRFLQKY